MTNLKPCPFCAGEELSFISNFKDNWLIGCNTCGILGPFGYSEEGAVNNWNDRHYYGDTRVTNNDNDPRI